MDELTLATVNLQIGKTNCNRVPSRTLSGCTSKDILLSHVKQLFSSSSPKVTWHIKIRFSLKIESKSPLFNPISPLWSNKMYATWNKFTFLICEGQGMCFQFHSLVLTWWFDTPKLLPERLTYERDWMASRWDDRELLKCRDPRKCRYFPKVWTHKGKHTPATLTRCVAGSRVPSHEDNCCQKLAGIGCFRGKCGWVPHTSRHPTWTRVRSM